MGVFLGRASISERQTSDFLAISEKIVYSSPMLNSQAVTLNETGLALLKKAEACTKASDVKSFTELGTSCLKEARDILDKMRSNSILVFLECCAHLKDSGSYGHYLDFCARNGLEILSEEDFNNIV